MHGRTKRTPFIECAHAFGERRTERPPQLLSQTASATDNTTACHCVATAVRVFFYVISIAAWDSEGKFDAATGSLFEYLEEFYEKISNVT